MCHDQRVADVQRVKDSGEPVRLRAERIVRVLGARRPAHAEWVNDDGSIAGRVEAGSKGAVPETRTEQPRHEYDRIPVAGYPDPERFLGRHLHGKSPRRICNQ